MNSGKLADLQVEVAAMMKDTVEARRVDPRDDLLSALWRMEFGGRPATADMIVEGAPIRKGDQAVAFLPAANLDCRKFERVEQFDLGRDMNAHIVFGAGPHRCVGAHLAQIELQVLYQEFLKRPP